MSAVVWCNNERIDCERYSHAWDVVNPSLRGGTASLGKDSTDAVRFAHHILPAT